MGTLADGIVQGAAGAREMRTAPLWGLRTQTRLLHDGHARDRFAGLAATDRTALLAFLGAL